MSATNSRKRERGSALLTVLWLTVALSLIAFAVANTVRGEIERSISQQENLRAYYLAKGAVERTLFLVRNAPASGMPFESLLLNSRRGFLRYATGDVLVEVVSEQGKLPLAAMNPQRWQSLLLAVGATSQELNLALPFLTNPAALMQIAGPAANSGAAQTFSGNFASLENVEDLMQLPGISSRLVFGRFARRPDGSIFHAGGLEDCVSPWAEPGGALDVWSVHPTLLIALGMDPAAAYNLAQARALPWREALDAVARLLSFQPPAIPLTASRMGSAFRIRATARLRTPAGMLTESRRTVALLVRNTPPPPQFFWLEGLSYLRWYDNAYSDIAAQRSAWLEVEARP
jgi:general secretion pathway protein K